MKKRCETWNSLAERWERCMHVRFHMGAGILRKKIIMSAPLSDLVRSLEMLIQVVFKVPDIPCVKFRFCRCMTFLTALNRFPQWDCYFLFGKLFTFLPNSCPHHVNSKYTWGFQNVLLFEQYQYRTSTTGAIVGDEHKYPCEVQWRTACIPSHKSQAQTWWCRNGSWCSEQCVASLTSPLYGGSGWIIIVWCC